jgi:co-chaperonin GroES (HSP10)
MLVPLFARVLLKRESLKSKNVILTADVAAKYASYKCEVLAVGPNCDESIKVGDTVIIGKYSGVWLDENGRPEDGGEYYICVDEDILCKVEA